MDLGKSTQICGLIADTVGEMLPYFSKLRQFLSRLYSSEPSIQFSILNIKFLFQLLSVEVIWIVY